MEKIELTCGDCGKQYSSEDCGSYMYIPWCCRQYMLEDKEFYNKVVVPKFMMTTATGGWSCPHCDSWISTHMGIQTSGGLASHIVGGLNKCCYDEVVCRSL